jgi:hypothetical protein
LFKWTPEKDTRPVMDYYDIFFARQVIVVLFRDVKSSEDLTIRFFSSLDLNCDMKLQTKKTIANACATQAILSILLNVPNLNLGSVLTEFKEFTKDFDAEVLDQKLKQKTKKNNKVTNNF